jgi:hypothetical protein
MEVFTPWIFHELKFKLIWVKLFDSDTETSQLHLGEPLQMKDKCVVTFQMSISNNHPANPHSKAVLEHDIGTRGKFWDDFGTIWVPINITY